MTDKTTAALKLAEEALVLNHYYNKTKQIEALAAIREALAEQDKQEPVAWWELNEDIGAWFLAYTFNPKAKTRPLIFGDVFQSQDSTIEERSWSEDFSHENGEYCKACVHCQRQFIGHKRRVSCKVCSNAAPVSAKRELVDLTVSDLDAIIEKHYDDEMDLKAMILDGIAAFKEKNK